MTNHNVPDLTIGEDSITIKALTTDDIISLDENCMVGASNGHYFGDDDIGELTIANISSISDAVISTIPTATSWTYNNASMTLGDTDQDKSKIYIVEPWQSRNPIQVDDGLCVSLEHDLIPNDEIKRKIMDKLEETNPDVVVKMGINPSNIKLVKSEVNIEINKEIL